MVTRSIKAHDRYRGNETMMKLWHLVKGRTCGDNAEQTHGGVSLIHMHTFNSKVGWGGWGFGGGGHRQTFDMHHWYAINISGRV